VEERLIGTAFGVLFSLYNAATFCTPLLFGYLRDQTGDWTVGCIVFAAFGLVGSVASALLWQQDHKQLNGVLQNPSPGVSFSCNCCRKSKHSSTPTPSSHKDKYHNI
jgi:MFS family permease